jgi:hypothetical protein
MESHDPSVTPTYSPGEEVLFRDPSQGWDQIPGRVVRVVRIAPLSHQTARYLYQLELDEQRGRVLATDEETIRPPGMNRFARSA